MSSNRGMVAAKSTKLQLTDAEKELLLGDLSSKALNQGPNSHGSSADTPTASNMNKRPRR